MKFNIIKKKVAAGDISPEEAGFEVLRNPERAQLGRRKRRKLTLKEKLILIIPAVAVIIAAVLVYVLVRGGNNLPIGEPACQYYAGSTFYISENASLMRKKDEVYLEVNGDLQKLSSLPIYYTERRAMLLPTDMVYCIPRSGDFSRAPQFAEVECDEYGGIKLRGDKKTVTAPLGFLYDGGDYYVFLEPVTLRFNGYKFDLPAMSYVEAVYAGQVMVFNYETREFFAESPKGSVIAESPTGDYTVSLLDDSMTPHDGIKSLLFTRPDLLDSALD